MIRARRIIKIEYNPPLFDMGNKIVEEFMESKGKLASLNFDGCGVVSFTREELIELMALLNENKYYDISFNIGIELFSTDENLLTFALF